MTPDFPPRIEAQLAEMREMILQIQARLGGPQLTRESYNVDEAAKLLGKRPYTVREWCRDGRINASKRSERRGGAELWSISAAEIARYKDEGLLPPRRGRDAA